MLANKRIQLDDQEAICSMTNGQFEFMNYQKAILMLFNTALTDSASGVASAEVLLSIMCGSQYHMDLTNFLCFDPDHFVAAISVIYWRQFLSIAPSTFLTAEQIEQLEILWPQLAIKNRY